MSHYLLVVKYGNLGILNEFADILYSEPKEYLTILKHELAKGISYPQARENAILFYLNDVKKYSNILSSPNNILAVEYLKAIKKLKSKVLPITVKRVGTPYNSLKRNGNVASATAVRNFILNNKNFQDLVPKKSYKTITSNIEHGKIINDLSVYEKEIIYTLRKMKTSEIAELNDVTEGLENVIKKAASTCNNLEDLISSIKSKRYTQTRIQRILLNAMLGITKKDVKDALKTKPYIRVLGLNEKGKELLSKLTRSNTKYEIVTSVKRFAESNNNRTLTNMLEKDILATNIYTLGYEFDSKSNLDFTKKLIIK